MVATLLDGKGVVEGVSVKFCGEPRLNRIVQMIEILYCIIMSPHPPRSHMERLQFERQYWDAQMAQSQGTTHFVVLLSSLVRMM